MWVSVKRGVGVGVGVGVGFGVEAGAGDGTIFFLKNAVLG